MPATVVEIDQKSLAAIGQWPWPRTEMAKLVDAIRRERPAAIALDILMPEADALSPERLLARTGAEDAALVDALAGRPTNDAVLAGSACRCRCRARRRRDARTDGHAAARSAFHRARSGRERFGVDARIDSARHAIQAC